MNVQRSTAKAIVNNLVGFGIGSVTSTAVKQSMPKTGNAIIDTVIVVSAFTTSWMVSSTVQNPVRVESERQIDAVYDFFENAKKNN